MLKHGNVVHGLQPVVPQLEGQITPGQAGLRRDLERGLHFNSEAFR